MKIENFGKRLKRLRTDYGISQKEVAEMFSISISLVSKYESDDQAPSLDLLLRLADLFNVSTDYLLMLTNEKNENIKNIEQLKPYFAIIQELAKEDINPTDLLNMKIFMKEIKQFAKNNKYVSLQSLQT